MRICMNIGGDATGAPTSPAEVVAEAVAAEADGFAAAWTVHFTRGTDALSVLAVAGAATSTIELGVGIVPSYPRHPAALAQQAATVQAFCGGRLTLGVGVSHKPAIEGMLGIPYLSPAEHMAEYLQVLGPLLAGGEVVYSGKHYAVNGGFAVPGTHPVSVVVGALGPRMVEVAGRHSDGVITWLAGPRTLGGQIVPTVSKAAADAGRVAPRVVAGVPFAVCDDLEVGRAQVAETFARYGTLENYRRLFEREGVDSAVDLALVGTESQLEAALRRYADAGVTEFWPAVFGAGPDPAAGVRRSRELLRSLS